MKKLLLFMALMAFTAGLQAQCPSGTITLSTQAQVDAFANNCTDLPGSLRIGDFSSPFTGTDITDLTPLSNLEAISGILSISVNSSLTSLSGLDGLSSVGGGLFIFSNSSLTSLSGLEGLSSVGGNLLIESNSSLTSLSGLGGLATVGGSLSIESNSLLTSLSGLGGLSSVGGVLQISSNSSLTSLSGLGELSSVGDDLRIGFNSSLTSLSGLEGLSSVGRDLAIGSNSSLTSLSGLEGLSSVGGDLGISSNSSLTSLSGLDGLSSVGGGLSISFNGSLTSLLGLDGISSVGGGIEIRSNNSLTSLSGLEGLSSVGGSLSISFNGSLTSLLGLDGISSLGGGLFITNNSSLTACSIDAVCNKLNDPEAFISIGPNASGCNDVNEVEDNCGPALEALCQSATVTLQPGGTASISASDVDGGSSGFTNSSVSPATFDCSDLGNNTVTLTVDDGNGNSDDCTATVTVALPDGPLPPWSTSDIGQSQNEFGFDPCTSGGEFSLASGGTNWVFPTDEDNTGFIWQEICGDGSITVKVESVQGGLGGITIRESTDPGARMYSLFTDLAFRVFRSRRTATGANSQFRQFFKPHSWLRLERKGNLIWAYSSLNGVSFSLREIAVLPMGNCLKVGMAVSPYSASAPGSAVFSNVTVTGGSGYSLSQEVQETVNGTSLKNGAAPQPGNGAKLGIPAQEQGQAALFPNPTSGAFTLRFERPLQATATAVLRNELGQALQQLQLPAGTINHNFDGSNLPRGLYFLEVRDEQGYREVLKVVRQ